MQHIGVKLGLVFFTTLIASIISLHFRFFLSFISIVTCYVMYLIFMQEGYVKIVERMLGPAIAAVITVLLLQYIKNPPLSMLLSLGLTWFFCYYYAQEHFGYSMLLGAVTVGIISVSFFLGSKHTAYEIAIYWVLNLAIGAIIVFVFSFLARCFKLFKVEPKHKPSHLKEFKTKTHFKIIPALVALRIVLSIFAVALFLHLTHQDLMAMQAVIAAFVVSGQFDLKMNHHRVFARVIGVILGAVLAIIYGHILTYYPSQLLLVVFIVLTLTVFTYIYETAPAYAQYSILQAGVMIPLILLDTHSEQVYNSTVGYIRAIGSLEGGLIALCVVYIFHFPLQFLLKKQSLYLKN